MFNKGFWALQVAPGQSYTQIVSEPFRISLATVVPVNPQAGGRTTLFVRVNTKEFVLCTLRPGQIEQQQLDITFAVDEEVSFYVRGSSACPVQLIGNTLMTEEDIFRDELAKLAGKLNHDELISVLNRMGDPDDEIDSDDIPSSTEEDAEEDSQSKDSEEEDSEEEEEDSEEEERKPVPEKKRMTLSADDNGRAKKSKVSPDGQTVKTDIQKLKKLPSGLEVKTVKEGNGRTAKQGDKVGVRYIGKLENGKLFDKSPVGETFSFTLGASEVIKGWDLGIHGMKVGEVRDLKIPSALAYGARGAPPRIPPNTALVFKVKLISLK
ncbi:hypothetical protein BX666DRAFT_2022756 [Dichotomocladium elegans]|nr:hypothetical protein BX666DRAFT_2022756 [Dichotomocladium elegans]